MENIFYVNKITKQCQHFWKKNIYVNVRWIINCFSYITIVTEITVQDVIINVKTMLLT